MEFESVLDGKARRAERSKIIQKYRHMDVRAPFARAWIRLPRGECIFEIEEHREFAVLLLESLREVDGLRVPMKHVDGFFVHLWNVNRGGLLKLKYRNARIDEFLQRDGDIFVFNRLMTNIEYGADVTPQRRVRF